MSHLSGRRMKKKAKGLLCSPDVSLGFASILSLPARQVINPLISFFYSGDEILKWRAVCAAGMVTAGLADKNMESARVIMRRLMWNLNDESGGIGWGSPEAMGEIMARHGTLAREFSSILVSYIDEEKNYLEHEILQRGVLWGLGRLAYARPSLVAPAAQFLPPFLRSPDPVLRGHCAWTAGAIPCEPAHPLLEHLATDGASLNIWIDDRLVPYTVGQLACDALAHSTRDYSEPG